MVKETSALDIIMDNDIIQELMDRCGEMGHLHCCFELLRIHPVPVRHPIMNVLLQVMAKFAHAYIKESFCCRKGMKKHVSKHWSC